MPGRVGLREEKGGAIRDEMMLVERSKVAA